MTSPITIPFSADQPGELDISYVINVSGDIQEITCTIVGPRFPIWLQLRKFILMSQKKDSHYVPLFSELNNSKNLATTLFIDQAYTSIMSREKFKVWVA